MTNDQKNAWEKVKSAAGLVAEEAKKDIDVVVTVFKTNPTTVILAGIGVVFAPFWVLAIGVVVGAVIDHAKNKF